MRLACRLVLLLVAIALAAPARAIVVSGRVTTIDSGQAAAGAKVRLVRQVTFAQQQVIATTTADANGAYAFSAPGVFGSIYVTATLLPYLETSVFGQTFDDIPQVRDVVLSMPGSIAVTVRDAISLQPIADKNVWFHSSDLGIGISTDAQGRATWILRPAGTYRACVVDDGDAWRNECQGDQHLGLPTAIETAAPFVLGSGENAQLVIDLDPGASIAGTVTDRYVNAPATGPLKLELFDAAGASLASADVAADSNGNYAVHGLPAGSYRLGAAGRRENHYTPRVYPDVDCAQGCAVTAGTIVHVPGLATIAGIDFALHPGSVARGTLSDRATGAPIANAEVVAYQQLIFGAWVPVARARSDAAGHFAVTHIQPSVPTRLGSGATTHVNLSWPDTVCYGPPCADGASTTFGVDQVLDGFDFVLDRVEGAFVDGFEE